MEPILNFVRSQPLWIWIAAGAAILLVVFIIISSVVSKRRFLGRIRRYLAIPGNKQASDYFKPDELLRKTRLLQKYAEGEDVAVVDGLGLDELWTQRLFDKEKRADFQRVLTYATEKGLFACFFVSLHNGRLAAALRSYLSENSDFLVLRRLAVSGKGEEFSGESARRFFEDRVDEIREMTGDPEWPSRYFAVKILTHDQDERSTRALWDAFADPHPLIRRTAATEFKPTDREKLYEQLHSLFLHDPVFEVRDAARRRIRADLGDLYSLDAKQLDPEEAFHVVELLDVASTDDENAALELLAGESKELRLAAARFLVECGTLERLFLQADLGDREDLNRSLGLLGNAVDVNVVSFIGAIRHNPSPGSLLIAAKLLQQHGSVDLIVELAERVFRLQAATTPNYLELYQETVNCLSARASDSGLEILAKEILRQRGNAELLSVALGGVPRGRDHVFAETLLDALRDPEFPCRDALRSAVCKLDTPIVLSEALGVLTAGREAFPHRVRIDALRILGELNLPYALQDILEHLPILPLAEAREFAAVLQQFQETELDRKVGQLLDSVDGNIRSAVITALPATGKKTFLAKIKAALGDADPDVRVSATWALVDYEETRALGQAADMLRDPVARVRASVARALGQAGGAAAIEALKRSVNDENEVESVQRAAIEGLGASTVPEAVDILVEKLPADDELTPDVLGALASKTDGRSLMRLVEQFKDGEPALRDRITEAFRIMGEYGEDAIRDLLDEDIASLRPFLADILEATGYIESRIRMLSHRDPRLRRSAASFLAKVGSPAAFRGIVLAARDPDGDVRVQVTKALERLATTEGKDILAALEQDPDRRIRKYTHWALERLKAKEL